MKNTFIAAFFMLVSMSVSAQTLDRMQWFNEPEYWSVKNDVLTMDAIAISITSLMPKLYRTMPDM